MGIFADSLRELAPLGTSSLDDQPTVGGEFVKGMRSGSLSMRSSFNNALGAAGASLGLDNFSRDSYADADRLAQEAAAAAPRVTSFRDIGAPGGRGTLRDSVDWAAGTVGSVVPSAAVGIGAGVLTPVGGLGAAGALAARTAAGTLAYTPLEAGDVVGRMREQGQPVDTAQAFGTGLGSAALQSVVPSLVAGRLAPAAVGAARQPMTLGRAGATLAGEGLLEGATEAGGEAVKQLGTGKTLTTLDGGQLVDSFAGGVVGGAAMSGAGSAGQAARESLGAVPKGLQGAKDAATGLLARGKTAAEAATPASVKDMDPVETLRGMYDDTRTKAKDVLQKIADSEDVIGDIRNYAGMQGEKLKAAVAGDNNERIKAVESYVQELAGKVLTPEQQQAIAEWTADKGNLAKQAAVAGIKRTKDGLDTLAQHMRDFADRMKVKRTDGSNFDPSTVVDAEQPSGETKRLGVKKSEDFSGVDEAILQELVPVLLKARPELATENPDPQLLRAFAGGVRRLLSDLSAGREPNVDALDALIDVAGPEATNIIQAAQRALGASSDPAKSKAFFKGLLALDDMQRQSADVVSQLRAALLPERQKTVSNDDLRKLARELERWSKRDRKPGDPQAELQGRQVRDMLRTDFGDNTDSVLKLMEARVTAGKDNLLVEVENRAALDSDEADLDELDDPRSGFSEKDIEEAGDTIRFFGRDPKTGEQTLYENPAGKEEKIAKDGKKYPHATLQAIEKAKTRFPGMAVGFRPASELGDDHPLVKSRMKTLTAAFEEAGLPAEDATAMAKKRLNDFGVVVAEGSKQETRITPQELKSVQFQADPETGKKKTSHYNSAAALKTGTESSAPVIDAVRLTNWMEGKLRDNEDNRTAFDNKGAKYRKARMFKEGVAAVQDHLGRTFDIPDSTVISLTGGKEGPLTWGEVKNLKEIGPTLRELRAQEAKARAEFVALTAKRPLRRDGTLGWFEKGSENAKRLWRSEQDMRRFKELADKEEVRALMDEATQADGGRPSNATVEKLMDKASNDSVRLLLQEKLDGRRDGNESEGSVDDPGEMSGGVPSMTNLKGAPSRDNVHAALRGGTNRAAEIRTNETGLPRSKDGSVTRSPPAASVKPHEWAEWSAPLLKPGSLDAALADLRTLDGEQLLQFNRYVSSLTEPPPGGTKQRLNQMIVQSQRMLDALEQASARSAGRGLRGATGPVPSAVGRGEQLGLEGMGQGEQRDAPPNMLDLENPEVLLPQGQRPPASKGPGADARRTPGPKAVAAKKAALLKAASSGDPALLQQLRTSNDAKGLQRAVNALNEARPDAGTLAAIDAANGRLAELIRGDESVGYGLQTKRYSLLSTQIHNDLGRMGFAATHDSPIRHEGKFDWRKHKLKGEGAAAFGMGTYLSTGDGVHKYYKKQFTATVAANQEIAWQVGNVKGSAFLDDTYGATLDSTEGLTRAEQNILEAMIGRGVSAQEAADKMMSEINASIARNGKSLLESHPDVLKPVKSYLQAGETIPDAALNGDIMRAMRPDIWNKNIAYRDKLLAELKVTDLNAFTVSRPISAASPTYEVSVDIPPEQLLNWDKPLSGQSATVRLRALKAMRDNGIEPDGKGYQLSDWRQHADDAWNDGGHTIRREADGTFVFTDVNTDETLRLKGKTIAEAVESLNAILYGGPTSLTGEKLYKALTEKLGSQEAASDYLQSLGILGHTYAAANGSNGKTPNYVIYDDSKITTNYVHFSHERTAPGGKSGADARKEAMDYLLRTHGDSVRVAWAKLLHAGEFERVEEPGAPFEDIIRLSVHAMNPLSVAYHESLHAFFAKLHDLGTPDIMNVLHRAADSAPVMNQLKKLLANEPAALEQLKDPEERVAYMYQFWATKDANGNRLLNIGPETQSVFQRIAQFIRDVLGIWSNDERAVHVLEYFHNGEFNSDRVKPFAADVIRQKVMAPGRNKAVDTARTMTEPLLKLGDSLMVAGSQRLRDTGIPALRELADAMKLHGTDQGDDPGFIPAARTERARVMNELARKLKGVSEDSLAAALQSLQTKSNDAIKAMADQAARGDAYTAKAEIRAVLDSMFEYMRKAGVKVNDLGVGKDYFPRMYDTSFISSHQKEFKAVLAKHGVTDADAITRKIMANEGSEFTVEVDMPGMQHIKVRKLAFIPDAELAPFMRKDALEILNNYVTQATRRAEWARRFGDDGSRIERLMSAAMAQGATPEQIKTAQDFVRSVDGTLGDTIDPSTRRLFGNMMVYQNIRLLPMAIFSSVVDPMGVMVRGGSVRDSFNTFKRGVRETVKNFKKNATDDDMTQLAASLGTIDDSMLLKALGATYSQGMVGDTGRRINDLFFRYNLMEQFNTSMRVGATEAALGFLARHKDGTASRHSKRWLNELGLEPGDVQLDADGRPLLFEHQGLTAEQAAKMRLAVNRWVDGAVLRPDASDKAIWMNDPHFALFAHLKTFVFAFHQTILKRVMHEYEHGNHAPAMALASYVPIMIASDLIKGFIQGGGEQPEWKQGWGVSDYVMSGVERAGLYGTGQFVVDAVQDFRQGGTGVGALLGPTVEQLADAAGVMSGRERFGSFVLESMPANALYREAFQGGPVNETVRE